MVASTAVAATRPAQAVLLPALVHGPEQLTAMNVVTGWIESVGIVAAGAIAGALLAVGGAGAVFATCAGLGAGAGLLVATVRTRPLAIADAGRVPRARSRMSSLGFASWRASVTRD